MPSDQKPASPDQEQLAEYRVWDRVEQRLWSRARLILLAAVVLVVLVAFLGIPLVEERLEQRVTERAEKCDNCHGNADLFLTEDDLLPYEIEANQNVIVDQDDIPEALGIE